MLMKSFGDCKALSPASFLVDVWLDAGREGRVFSYRADPPLALQSGDIVRVRLRGRAMNGLVVKATMDSDCAAQDLQPIETLLQRAAIDSTWYRCSSKWANYKRRS